MENKYQLGIRAIHQKDIKTAIIEAKQNNFDVLEIHFSSPQFQPENYTASQLGLIKKFAQKNNIILQTHSEIGQSLILANKFSRIAEKQKIKQMIWFSRRIGARSLTLHPGKAPVFHTDLDIGLKNEDLYGQYYSRLFEDSIKFIISIAPKDICICIENTDSFNVNIRQILDKYLKASKVFLTWDIMKGYTYKPSKKFRQDHWEFLKRNIDHVRNLHISGPAHGSIKGHEQDYIKFLKIFKNKKLPLIVEILSLKDAILAKKIIRTLGF